MKNWSWLLAVCVLIGFVSNQNENVIKKEKKMSKKRMNIIGISILGLIIIIALAQKVVENYKNKGRINETQKIVNQTSRDFANKKDEIVVEWTNSKIKDSWGNELSLSSDREKGVQFRSNGVDGEEGTEDDIVSQWHTPTILTQVREKIEETDGKIEKVGGIWEKAKTFFSK